MKPPAIIAPAISEAEIVNLIADEASEEELRAYRTRLTALEARSEGLAYVASLASLELLSPKKPGPCVYFVRAGLDGPIKIGQTDNIVADRVRALQTGNHNELQLLTHSRLLSERRLHQIFAHLRIRGEWFRATPELLTVIAAVADLPGDERVIAVAELGSHINEMLEAASRLVAEVGAKITSGNKALVADADVSALRLAQQLIGALLEWMEHHGGLDLAPLLNKHGVDDALLACQRLAGDA